MKPQYRAALRQPLNVAMLIATLLAGLLAAWWMFLIGLVLWGFMVWGVATHPVTQLESTQPERPVAVPRFQSSLDRIENSQRQVLNAIGATKNPIRQALTPLQTEVNGLVDKCHAVAQRAIPLEAQRQARAKMDGNLESEIATLDQQLAQFTDDGIKKVFARSSSAVDCCRTAAVNSPMRVAAALPSSFCKRAISVAMFASTAATPFSCEST